MNTPHTLPARGMRTRFTALALVGVALCSVGCLGQPKLEDRWTRVDMPSSNLTAAQAVQAGSALNVQVGADITYRRILTGFLVAELRASSSFTPGSLQVRPGADRLQMANDVDRLLATSVSMGRATRAVTGWDHLIQRVDLSFTGIVPGSVTDSLGTGPTAGLFLVCYMGSGVEIRQQSGADSIAVTPFPSNQFQILPVGLPLTVTP